MNTQQLVPGQYAFVRAVAIPGTGSIVWAETFPQHLTRVFHMVVDHQGHLWLPMVAGTPFKFVIFNTDKQRIHGYPMWVGSLNVNDLVSSSVFQILKGEQVWECGPDDIAGLSGVQVPGTHDIMPLVAGHGADGHAHVIKDPIKIWDKACLNTEEFLEYLEQLSRPAPPPPAPSEISRGGVTLGEAEYQDFITVETLYEPEPIGQPLVIQVTSRDEVAAGLGGLDVGEDALWMTTRKSKRWWMEIEELKHYA